MKRVFSHDVVYEVFCFGSSGTVLSDDGEAKLREWTVYIPWVFDIVPIVQFFVDKSSQIAKKDVDIQKSVLYYNHTA